MAFKSITEVRDALYNALKSIKIANGYSFDLPDSNILDNYEPKFEDRKEDVNYPKAMLILDDGTNEDLPSRKRDKTLIFIIVLVDKAFLLSEDVYDLSAEKKAEKMIDAIDLLTARNPSLGGVVENCTIEGFTTDSGYTHPEGTSVVRLVVTYKKQF